MKLPRLPITSSNSLTKAETFGGLNKTDTYIFGELSECKNITSDNYPALASRKGRFIAPIMGKGTVLGCGSSEEFYYVYNDEGKSYFVYGGVVKGEWEDSEAKKKSFAEVGRYICIYPDLMYYRKEDTEGIEEYKKTMSNEIYKLERARVVDGERKLLTYTPEIERDFTGKSIHICNVNGNDNSSGILGIGISEILKVTECNTDESNGYYGMSFDGWLLKKIASIQSFTAHIKEAIPEEYYEKFGCFKVMAPASMVLPSTSCNYKKMMGIEIFQEGAAILVLDGPYKGLQTFSNIEIDISSRNGTDIHTAKIVIADGTLLEDCDIELCYPVLEMACSSNNRIFGIEKGVIYASALGNPWSFYQYGGTAADSWTVDVLSNGDFTAAFEYAGMPHFAKKDRIIKLYGTSPSTYQTSELLCDGVLDGESVSLCGPCMYWLSENGVMRYTGSYPVKVSEKLGSGIISGVGASSSNKYYLYSGYADGKKALYVYDTEKGLWHSEDCGEIESAVCHDGKIYAISEDGVTVLYGNELLTDEEKEKYGFVPEAAFDSYAVLSDNYENTFYHKYVSKLIFRLQASDDAHIRFYLRYDNDEMKTLYYEYIGNGERDNIYIPIIPRRCDRYELSIEGEGEWKIISMARELSGGSTKKNIMR